MSLLLVAGVWLGLESAHQRIEFSDQPPAQTRRVIAARERIDPNTASIASMRRLRGIGPARAAAIVEYRTAHGPNAFKVVGDLVSIKGVGPGTIHGISSELSLPE
ncbi:MAG: helix-hairpin-helix domain-containing protein [Phycisphaerae bacterium]|nr:helix-hairpin-helix domain-containing protein [Phycisphaerae bacterium]